jgi:DNA polymerase I-like protein with 3'-5' exonuclease and polymerase domains
LEAPTTGWYDSLRWITLDFETTNKEKGDPRAKYNRLVKICVDGQIVDESHLLTAFQDPCILIAHNAKFELGWLIRYGVDVSKILPFDTMIAEYVLAGNRDVELSLGAIAKRYGLPGKEPVVDRMIQAGVCPSEIPEKWLEDRVRYDVRTTTEIARRQFAKLKDGGLLPVFMTRCIVTPVLAAVEAEGMELDAGRVAAVYAEFKARRDALDLDVERMTGGINMRSTKQKAEYLYDTLKFDELVDRNGAPKRTPSDGRMTDADTLLALKATTPEQKAFLKLQKEHAKVDAALSKSLECFQGACEDYDGRLYGTFNQAITGTHRLSATAKRIQTQFGERGAQFQNMPRAFKRLFRARSGRLILEADYRQLEFITAGNLSLDRQVKLDVENKADVHKFTASILKQKPISEVTADERQAAKASTFKPLYGGQSGTTREKAYFKAFREKYPEVDATQRKWLAEVLERKQLRTASGLIFYWPDTKVTPSGYVTNTASIFNYPVQSFATADIVPVGLVYTFWRSRHLDARLVNTVHDSIVMDVDRSALTELASELRQAMVGDVDRWLTDVYGFRLWIPLSGEVKYGSHWGADKDRGEKFDDEYVVE